MLLTHVKPGSVVAQNRKARFNYEIEHSFEAGLALLGSEVKSLRQGKVNIADAYVIERDGDLYLQNAYIAEYKEATRQNHPEFRLRQLLLKRKEINKLIGQITQKGYTLIPLKLYFNSRNLAKIELGLGKGKKLHDKREAIKERDWERQKARNLSE